MNARRERSKKRKRQGERASSPVVKQEVAEASAVEDNDGYDGDYLSVDEARPLLVSHGMVDRAAFAQPATSQRTKTPAPMEPAILESTPELERLRTQTPSAPSQIAATPSLERKKALTKLRLEELKVSREELQLERELLEME